MWYNKQIIRDSFERIYRTKYFGPDQDQKIAEMPALPFPHSLARFQSSYGFAYCSQAGQREDA